MKFGGNIGLQSYPFSIHFSLLLFIPYVFQQDIHGNNKNKINSLSEDFILSEHWNRTTIPDDIETETEVWFEILEAFISSSPRRQFFVKFQKFSIHTKISTKNRKENSLECYIPFHVSFIPCFSLSLWHEFFSVIGYRTFNWNGMKMRPRYREDFKLTSLFFPVNWWNGNLNFHKFKIFSEVWRETVLFGWNWNGKPVTLDRFLTLRNRYNRYMGGITILFFLFIKGTFEFASWRVQGYNGD